MSADNFQTQRAKTLLAHYLKFGLEAANYRWDSDNQAEVADIVDSIIDAAAQPTPPAQPDALTRIADALERIADRLDAVTIGPESVTVRQDPAA